MRIAMIGTGYVGLVSGACFSDFGHDVICVDKDRAQDRRAQAGRDADLRAGARRAGRAQRARRAGSPSPPISTTAVAGADAVFIAVGTPSRRGDGHADLTYVFGAAEEIAARADAARPWSSPSRPCRSAPATRSSGSSARSRPDADVAVVSNPEFLREGAAIEDFKRPDRIVIGTEDERARERDARDLPAALPQQGAAPVHRPAHRRADQICRQRLPRDQDHLHQRDRRPVRERSAPTSRTSPRGIGLDNRIGAKFLHAGPGYGGSCFPKDTLALLKTAEDHRGAAADRRDRWSRSTTRASARWAARSSRRCGGDARGRTVALLGLTFKPNTDDMRDAPSLSIVQALQDAGATVRGYDPEGMEQARPMMPDVDFLRQPL